MSERKGTTVSKDITNRHNWGYIANFLAPLECEVSHLTDKDFVDTVDENGVPCRRAELHFVEGTLTAEEEQFHWRFRHPGLEDGSISIHALNCDTTPGYSSVHIRVASEQDKQ